MIPHGREAVAARQFAELMGMSYDKFRRLRVVHQEGAPTPLNAPGRKVPLYDKEQAEAYAAGKALPVWDVDEVGHPEDRLDTAESAELLQVEPDTLHRYRSEGRLTDASVCGVPHYFRGELEYRRDNPGAPGRPRRQEPQED